MALPLSTSKTRLTVVGQKDNEIIVKFPLIETPIKMTISYFNQLKNTGKYHFCLDTIPSNVA
ncbi:MAG: hypothetical protein V3V14_03150 [Saprospiraceae bacterium]